ncbi:hypothetical protein Q9R30_18410, partial [Arthrobacter sp. AB6]|uniref:hypothetical protein n=1 Tax=Arthrobacter sp. AB6 TaxID=2962570 RepID=UPI002881039B
MTINIRLPKTRRSHVKSCAPICSLILTMTTPAIWPEHIEPKTINAPVPAPAFEFTPQDTHFL